MKNRKKINEAKLFYKQLILDENESNPHLSFSEYCYQNNLERTEDIRSTDWSYFLNISEKKKILVIGFGFGKLSEVLSFKNHDVDILDSDNASKDLALAFFSLNKNNQSFFETYEEIIKANKKYDLIYFSAFPNGNYPFDYHIEKQSLLLNRKGSLVINVANKLWPSYQSKSLTLFQYIKKISNSDMSSYEVFARIPDLESVPLFYIPLEQNSLKYFLKSIIGQVDNISPEAKRRYFFKYKIVSLFRGLITRRMTIHFIKYFFPAYTIICEK